MRIRITRKPTGTVDDVALDKFHVDVTYEVGPTVGNYLISAGFAVPTDEIALPPRLPEHPRRTTPVQRPAPGDSPDPSDIE
jgi:hypothetical protein